jgi:hypothetical protein
MRRRVALGFVAALVGPLCVLSSIAATPQGGRAGASGEPLPAPDVYRKTYEIRRHLGEMALVVWMNSGAAVRRLGRRPDGRT